MWEEIICYILLVCLCSILFFCNELLMIDEFCIDFIDYFIVFIKKKIFVMLMFSLLFLGVFGFLFIILFLKMLINIDFFFFLKCVVWDKFYRFCLI